MTSKPEPQNVPSAFRTELDAFRADLQRHSDNVCDQVDLILADADQHHVQRKARLAERTVPQRSVTSRVTTDWFTWLLVGIGLAVFIWAMSPTALDL